MYQYLKRALDGDKKSESEHEKELFQKAQELVEDYTIEYDGESFVPDDERLSDSVFEAGIDLLLSCGVYCTDTGRVIILEEDEILRALNTAKTLEIGRFSEKVSVPNRYPMDSEPPVIIGGSPLGTVSEENFLALHTSLAAEPIVQGLYAGAIETVGGESIKTGSPLELLSTLKKARLEKLAVHVAERNGLPLFGPGPLASAEESMLVSKADLYSASDVQVLSPPGNLKIDYKTFQKAIFHKEHGNNFLSSQHLFLGESAIRTPESLAVVDVAETLKAKLLTGADLHISNPVHQQFGSSSVKEILWASNLSSIAISRNMNYYTGKCYRNLAGCCTEMCFYESAAQAIGDTVTGKDLLISPVGAGGKLIDQSTALEARFMGEVAYMATELTRSEADEVLKEIYKKYGDSLEKPPAGKPFKECYAVKSEYEIKPTEEYMELYGKVIGEIEDYCSL